MSFKIYHLHPLVAGNWQDWPGQFARIRGLGFDTVCSAPPFQPGETGDIFVTADHERLHPALGWDGSADDGLARLAGAAADQGLRLLLDMTLDQVASDATIRQQEPGWFSGGFCGGPPDPRRGPQRVGVGHARFNDAAAGPALTAWWIDRLQRLLRAGIGGFRCLEPYRISGLLWHRVIAALRAVEPECVMLAWTPGGDYPAIEQLTGAGFDRVCASTAWWDGRASWLLDENELLQRIAPALGAPEPSFGERLATRLPPGSDLAAAYRHAARRAVALGAGWFMPMGFEFLARHPFDAARATPADLARARDEAPADLSGDLLAANALADRIAGLGLDAELRPLTAPGAAATALLRIDGADARDAERAMLVLLNPDPGQAAPLPIAEQPLPPQAGAGFVAPEPLDQGPVLGTDLAPGEVRVLAYTRAPDIAGAAPAEPLDRAAMETARIAIEAITPLVPDGDYAVKRVVGETVTVSADIVADGHEVLAAALLWRPQDATTWHQVPLQLVVNDRWEASFTPERVGPHVFTIEAWWDVWGTFRHDLHAKHAAGQSLRLEVQEGQLLLERAAARVTGATRTALQRILDAIKAADEAHAVALLLAEQTLAAMQAADDRPFSHPPRPDPARRRPSAGHVRQLV